MPTLVLKKVPETEDKELREKKKMPECEEGDRVLRKAHEVHAKEIEFEKNCL